MTATQAVAPSPLAKHRRSGRTRSVGVTAALGALLGLLFCVALSLGDLQLSLPAVVRALTGHADPGAAFVVQRLRLPRTLCAVLVGAALGVSGSIFQSVTRNVLATPDIIGVSSGASCTVAVAMLTFGLTGPGVALAAVAGALAAGIGIYSLAWRDGVHGYRLVLIGIGVAAFAAAITSYVLTSKPALETQRALFWLTGSLNETRWPEVWIGCVGLGLIAAGGPALARWISILELGDETAAALGLKVERTRLAVLLVATSLAGLAVSMAGPVAFVALVAAPSARRLTGSAGYLTWPPALVGALVVLAADVVGAHLLGSLTVPVGVLTAVIGAPYLLWLLARSNRPAAG